MDAAIETDHYVVLGLPSGVKGAKLTDKEISKAYRSKALELHPDKRPDDPNAHQEFQNLRTSYEILKDGKARKVFDDLLRIRYDKMQRELFEAEKARKVFDDLLRVRYDKMQKELFEAEKARKVIDDLLVRNEKNQRELFKGSKRRKIERPAYVYDPEEEEKIARQMKEEIARIYTMLDRKASSEERTLKVAWEKEGGDYSAGKLREIFGAFGVVEDVVMRKSSEYKRKAFVVMASEDAAIAATRSRNVLGDLSNPLLALPLLFSRKYLVVPERKEAGSSSRQM